MTRNAPGSENDAEAQCDSRSRTNRTIRGATDTILSTRLGYDTKDPRPSITDHQGSSLMAAILVRSKGYGRSAAVWPSHLSGTGEEREEQTGNDLSAFIFTLAPSKLPLLAKTSSVKPVLRTISWFGRTETACAHVFARDIVFMFVSPFTCYGTEGYNGPTTLPTSNRNSVATQPTRNVR